MTERPETWLARRETLKAKKINGNGAGMPLGIAAQIWPTPQKHDSHPGHAERVGRYGTKHGGRNLNDDVQLCPTPTIHGNYNRKGASATSGDGLATWATACSRDYRSPGRSRLERTGGKQGECLSQQVGGQLNPAWVEWLMGWPIAWTESAPLATARFRSWRRVHSAALRRVLAFHGLIS